MKNFIVANGIVRYQPGITRYQQRDITKKAEKIIADMEEVSKGIARCDLSRSQVLSLINTQIKNWSQTNEKVNKITLNIRQIIFVALLDMDYELIKSVVSPEEFEKICKSFI